MLNLKVVGKNSLTCIAFVMFSHKTPKNISDNLLTLAQCMICPTMRKVLPTHENEKMTYGEI